MPTYTALRSPRAMNTPITRRSCYVVAELANNRLWVIGITTAVLFAAAVIGAGPWT